ncbi:hypothetical protein SAMN04488556_1589 [Halostagnicola kamekurae]|uniref:Uncharacterized protein n=1 Tax=Halostagnicola kamekurae TaxID=619731 RepID=A0A1I6QUN6_9EURY|nr:hypothetical protein SAMN04488556_1589 [Halostagnicola kamekurae]
MAHKSVKCGLVTDLSLLAVLRVLGRDCDNTVLKVHMLEFDLNEFVPSHPGLEAKSYKKLISSVRLRNILSYLPYVIWFKKPNSIISAFSGIESVFVRLNFLQLRQFFNRIPIEGHVYPLAVKPLSFGEKLTKSGMTDIYRRNRVSIIYHVDDAILYVKLVRLKEALAIQPLAELAAMPLILLKCRFAFFPLKSLDDLPLIFVLPAVSEGF